jgi:hypothetical protein
MSGSPLALFFSIDGDTETGMGIGSTHLCRIASQSFWTKAFLGCAYL